MAMSGEADLLKEISAKLSELIVLSRLSNSKAIAETRKEMKEDQVAQAILDFADGTMSASQIYEKVIEKAKTSEPTVKRRIAYLLEKGAIAAVKKRKETYYKNTGLYE
jgi:Fic family protein